MGLRTCTLTRSEKLRCCWPRFENPNTLLKTLGGTVRACRLGHLSPGTPRAGGSRFGLPPAPTDLRVAVLPGSLLQRSGSCRCYRHLHRGTLPRHQHLNHLTGHGPSSQPPEGDTPAQDPHTHPSQGKEVPSAPLPSLPGVMSIAGVSSPRPSPARGSGQCQRLRAAQPSPVDGSVLRKPEPTCWFLSWYR